MQKQDKLKMRGEIVLVVAAEVVVAVEVAIIVATVVIEGLDCSLNIKHSRSKNKCLCSM